MLLLQCCQKTDYITDFAFGEQVLHVGHARWRICGLRNLVFRNSPLRIIANFYHQFGGRIALHDAAQRFSVFQFHCRRTEAGGQPRAGVDDRFEQLVAPESARYPVKPRAGVAAEVVVGVAADALRRFVSEENLPAALGITAVQTGFVGGQQGVGRLFSQRLFVTGN